MTSPGPRRDRGHVVVLVVIAVAVMAAAAALAVGELGRAAMDRARAVTAADAAALASLTGGRRAADAVADDNGATVVAWESDGHQAGVTVSVTVRVGRATATARATDAP